MHRKSWLALAAAPFLVSADIPSTIDSGWPPERFQKDGMGPVILVMASDVNAFCGRPPKGYTFKGCIRPGDGAAVMVLPNPCQPQFQLEQFAKIACHEAGHLQGWPATHGP